MKTFHANQALRRIRANTSKEDLRKLGLRLQGIHGGKTTQALYRQRGVDGFFYARTIRLARIAARKAKESKVEQGMRTRSKVNVGW